MFVHRTAGLHTLLFTSDHHPPIPNHCGRVFYFFISLLYTTAYYSLACACIYLQSCELLELTKTNKWWKRILFDFWQVWNCSGLNGLLWTFGHFVKYYMHITVTFKLMYLSRPKKKKKKVWEQGQVSHSALSKSRRTSCSAKWWNQNGPSLPDSLSVPKLGKPLHFPAAISHRCPKKAFGDSCKTWSDNMQNT